MRGEQEVKVDWRGFEEFTVPAGVAVLEEGRDAGTHNGWLMRTLT